jgi:uncharacterized protein YbjT (DUF2867 family)
MILVAGGSGTLGREIVRLLLARGIPVRVLTRQSGWSPDTTPPGTVEVIVGDIRDAATLDRAVAGAETVISCVQGFAGRDAAGPTEIDQRGNELLIARAQHQGVRRFLLLSIVGAAADSPVPLFRAKHRAEETLKGSALEWVIVRATAFMETWLELVGDPLVKNGRTRIFGAGHNPINFVAVQDVAIAVVSAALDPSIRDRTITVSGPENVTFDQFADTIESVTGRHGKIAHIPRGAMRILALFLQPFLPQLTGQMHAAIAMDTRDMTAPPTANATTRLADIAKSRYLTDTPTA